MILLNFIKDENLEKEVRYILKRINRQIIELEKVMAEHAVSLALQPASEIKITENISSFTDRYIFIRIYQSLKRFLPVHIVAFQQSTTPRLREMFKTFLLEEMELFEKFQDFGRKSNLLPSQPEYVSEKIRTGKTYCHGSSPDVEQIELQVGNDLSYQLYGKFARDSDLKAAITFGQHDPQTYSGAGKTNEKFAIPVLSQPPESEKYRPASGCHIGTGISTGRFLRVFNPFCRCIWLPFSKALT